MKSRLKNKGLLAAAMAALALTLSLGTARAAGDSNYDDRYEPRYYDDYSYYRPYDNYAKDDVYIDYPLYPVQNYQQPRPLIPYHPSAYYDTDHLFLDPFYYRKYDQNNYEKHQLEYLIKYGKIPYGQYYY